MMKEQNPAYNSLTYGNNEALESHKRRLLWTRYASDFISRMVPARNTQVSLISKPGQATFDAQNWPTNSDRRLSKCRRASNCLQHLALWPQWPHVLHRKKNTSWLNQNPLQPSQPTPASTSKNIAGQAFAPVLYPLFARYVRGAAC